MVSQNSEFTRKLRAAVRAKIEEYGIDVDDELPDYVMIMVGNKKDKSRMKADLKLFLGDNTASFVEWLFGFFQKVKQQSTSSSLPPLLNEATDKIAQTKEQPKKLSVISGDDLVFSKTEKVKTFSKAKPIESPKRKEKKDTSKTSKREKHQKSKQEHYLPQNLNSAHHSRKEMLHAEKKQHLQTRKKRQNSDEEAEQKVDISITPSIRKQLKIKPVAPSTTAPPTTFAIPRAVLRSVIVNPQMQQLKLSNAPRIIPPPRSPSPLLAADSPQFDIEYSHEVKSFENDQTCSNVESNTKIDSISPQRIEDEKKMDEEQTTIVTQRPHNREIVPKSKRRVLEIQSARLFQRAITCTQENYIRANTKSCVVETKGTKEIDKNEHKEVDIKIENESVVDQHSIRTSSNEEKAFKDCGGVAKVFAKAIKETRNQNETLSNVQNRTIERRAPKRVICVNELSNLVKTNNNFLENKRIRIEMEHPKDGITIKKLDNKDDQNNEDDEDSNILLVNMENKSSTRSICKERKEYKKPKFGLEMLKEHIKSSVEKTPKVTAPQCVMIEEVKEVVKDLDEILLQNIQKEEVENKKIVEEEEKEVEIKINEEENKIELSVDSTQQDIRKIREFVVNLPGDKSPSVVPFWNGCISIDDISSTDDEAEIDAVLEEQHSLKKMALEREKELKGRELPPTSALSRPLVHKRDVVVSLQETLMSPTGGVSDLLQQSIQQQFLVSSSSQQQQQSNNNTSRPYATVAPCQITTPTFTATSITETIAQQVQQNTVMSLVSQIAASVNTQNQQVLIPPICRKKNSRYRTFSKIYSPSSINIKQIYPFQNKLISQNQSIMIQLRERHRQTSKLYSDMLEEQLLLLAQIQKMSSDPSSAEKIKILMFRSKNLEKNSQQLKKQLEVLSANFVENVKK